MRVLLLNPPGKEAYLRDQYCGGTSTKADYYWHPIDLLMQSGIIAQEHEIMVLDANVNGLSVKKTLDTINGFEPDAIFAISSIISLEEDLKFFKLCKDEFKCKIIVSGDVYFFNTRETITIPVIDAILLDFSSDAILEYLRGVKEIKNIAYKSSEGMFFGELFSSHNFSIPIPRHDLFSLKSYRLPFMKYSPSVSISTSLGCPSRCSFCPMCRIKYRERDKYNLFEELDYVHKLGIREIVFRDPTFSANMQRTKEICNEMIKQKYDFGWFCDTRVDKVDDELLSLMKESGCHIIAFGVESGSEYILKKEMKDISKERITEIFNKCNALGIQTLAHFIIGFPSDTEETIKETVDFILTLKCDYLSLNMYVPRYGTPLSREFIDGKSIYDLAHYADSSKIEKSYCEVPLEELRKYKRLTILRFYLNPLRVLRLLSQIRTVTQLQETVSNGISILLK